MLDEYTFNSVFDIGCGDGQHSEMLKLFKKDVTAIDQGKSSCFEKNLNKIETLIGDYNMYRFDKSFDCVWASHVLKRQVNTHNFLEKICSDLYENGMLAITETPLKFTIVGGHGNFFNSGLLLCS